MFQKSKIICNYDTCLVLKTEDDLGIFKMCLMFCFSPLFVLYMYILTYILCIK